MPGTNGRELHAEMSARFPSLRAIFMSGHTDEVIVRHGLHEEGVALLLKPFTIHDLLARVRATLDGQGTR
jgi:two-component system cell cycle sensor histidine kinase/response regulator CckA